MVVYDGQTPRMAADFLARYKVRKLLMAGNSESVNPGIGGRVEVFLGRLFRL